MDILKIALIQTELSWRNKEANFNNMDKWFQQLRPEMDLVLLPETFTTGFAMKDVSSLAEKMDGPTVQWMRERAQKLNAVVCGSTMIEENEKYFNRLLWVEPNGQIIHYDKRHLFRLAYEQNYFTPGNNRMNVSLKGWNIRLNVCYDLRFPVWCRIEENDYDVLLVTANWPEARIEHWNALLKARAIENLSYVMACNRIGEDGTGKQHTGDSAVIDPSGGYLTHSREEGILYAELSKSTLDSARKRFQFYKDSDNYTIG